ncbi:MAG: AMP-binding protein [Clostridia bacterium]|nr:AMP-binding protein [Clostridia bacterium]
MFELLKHAFEEHKNRPAYKIGEYKLTYGELFDKASHYASLLRKQGSSPVILYGKKTINTVIGIISCILARRTYIPLDLNSPESRVKKITDIAGATLVVTSENINIDNVDCVSLDGLQSFADGEEKEPTCGDIVYIIFTSGTTGIPKGVPISNSNLKSFITWISAFSPLDTFKEINVMNQAEFCFDLSVADFYYALCNGHRLVSYEADKAPIADFVEENAINYMVITPTFARLCLLDEKFNASDCPTLKCIYFCGETLEKKTAKRLFRRFPDICLINAYGPTEATSAVSAVIVTRDMLDDERSLPIGKTGMHATEICIEDGEIVLKGNSVFGGYLGADLESHYVENGKNCYKTGDLGEIANGLLYYHGRMDSQIKYKGYRIELGDIESHLLKISGVVEAAVITKKSGDTIKGIYAFVVVKKDLDEDFIKSELHKTLPKYMMPKKVTVIDKMPVTNNKKLDRKALEML